MKQLGKQPKLHMDENARALTGIMASRPTAMPRLAEGHQLICAFDQAAYVHIFIVETLEDMQSLWDQQDFAVRVYWFDVPPDALIITDGSEFK